MREKILFDREWRFLENPPEEQPSKTKCGTYISAKTERLKWGPGAWSHKDVHEYWSFEEELPSERWEAVDLPHDYIVRQTPDPLENKSLGFFKHPTAWYRKHFTLSEEDLEKRLTILFEGVTGVSDIYLNGCFLRHNEGGYASFEVDISDLARCDRENVLAVRVNPNCYDGWWYAGGGIYRHVWLVKTDTVAVDLWGLYAAPKPPADGDTWEVPVEVACRNSGYEAVPAAVTCEVVSPDGDVVAKAVLAGTLEAREVTKLAGSMRAASPRLWSLESPVLYTLRATVAKGEGRSVCDAESVRFGFRAFRFDAKEGLFLNGKPVKVKGVCLHGDFGLTGKAVPDNICRYKIQLIKEMGGNAVRLSHYPHQEATLDACDEMGLLVMDENRRFESNDDTLSQMAMLVRRDRNHPSVFLWSTGNEEMDYHGRIQGHRIQRALAHEIHKWDTTRPVCCAMTNLDRATAFEECDVVAVNYSMRVLDAIHAKYADKPFISSENSANGTMRGVYYGSDLAHGLRDARDLDPPAGQFQVYDRADTWKYIAERPWLMGGFQWTGLDYRGEGACWPFLCSTSGAYDLFLQRKDAFYQNLSLWTEAPMAHLLPHWNHDGLEGMPIDVWCYTNAEEAELFLNGTSLGRQSVTPYQQVTWSVPYVPGRLEVVAYRGGREVARDVRETTGPAVGLRLEKMTPAVPADGASLALFSCIAVDAQGREVPTAAPMVRFECQGGAIVGTGASCTDPVPPMAVERRMFAGRITVAVRPSADAASCRLLAFSDGLRSALI